MTEHRKRIACVSGIIRAEVVDGFLYIYHTGPFEVRVPMISGDSCTTAVIASGAVPSLVVTQFAEPVGAYREVIRQEEVRADPDFLLDAIDRA